MTRRNAPRAQRIGGLSVAELMARQAAGYSVPVSDPNQSQKPVNRPPTVDD